MTKDGIARCKKVWDRLAKCDLDLSEIESNELAASEQELSTILYAIRNDVQSLMEQIEPYTKENSEFTQSNNKLL